MRRIGYRPTAVATLVLGALALASLASLGHGHDALASGDHSALPVYSAGHDAPDPTVHVEDASRIESESCVVCVHRQRQIAIAEPALGALGRVSHPSSVAAGEVDAVTAGLLSPPGSRAPPRV